MRWTLGLTASLGIAATACSDGNPPPVSVIVLTTENMWMHPSNPVAAEALRDSAIERGWTLQVTSAPETFDAPTLARTDVVVFSVTSGPILDESARLELEAFWRAGGGFVGIHSASATESDWSFYRELVPVTFRTHPTAPPVQDGQLTVESSHPIVADTPEPWLHADEFYTFNERPEDLGVDLLLALDESTMGPEYTSDVRVGYHPLAFAHENLGGRAFYTALGHTPESYGEGLFMDMLVRGIEWAGEPHRATR